MHNTNAPSNPLPESDHEKILALLQELEFAEAIVNTIPDALLVLDTELRVQSANGSFYELFQVSPEVTHGRLLYNLGNGQWNIPALRTLLEDVLPENKVFTGYEIEYEFEQIGRRVMLLNGRRLDHKQLILLIITDITKAKRAEAALNQVEIRYRMLFDSIDEAFCVVEMLFNENGQAVDYRFLETNPAFESQTGLQNVVGQRMRELEPRHEEEWFQTYGRIALTGQPERFSLVAHYLDNRWYDVYAFRIGQPEERRIAILFNDISERHRAEESLQRSEESYRLLVESAQEYAIFMLTPEGKIATWNSGAKRIFGYSEDEAIGLSGRAIFTEEDRAAGIPEAEMETALREGKANDDRWQLRRDGSRFWANGVTHVLCYADGRVRAFVKILRDNTEKKQAEEALRQLNTTLEERVRQRTQQVRTLARQLTMAEQAERRRISAILHDDLQQRLYVCQYQLKFLRDVLDEEQFEEARRTIAGLEAELRGSIQMARSLSVELSPPVLEGEGLREAVAWLGTQMRQQHGLSVTIQAEDDLPGVSDDLRVLLFQVVRELLFNIIKHAGVTEALVTLHRDNHALRIEVIDQGEGFDADTALTKSRYTQGLWRTQRRLELVGGQMKIESSVAGGTRVIIICASPNEALAD